MKELVAIDVNLENCEYFKFPVEVVEAFSVEGISKTITYVDGSLHEFIRCDQAIVSIKSEGNKKEYDETLYSENRLPFERFKEYQDIVSFGMHYSDGTVIDFYVKYADESRDTNAFQTQTYDYEGNFVILIDEAMVAEDYVL